MAQVPLRPFRRTNLRPRSPVPLLLLLLLLPAVVTFYLRPFVGVEQPAASMKTETETEKVTWQREGL